MFVWVVFVCASVRAVMFVVVGREERRIGREEGVVWCDVLGRGIRVVGGMGRV